MPTPRFKTARYTDDPKILAMSDEEYAAAVTALFGTFEHMDDEWLRDLRSGADERLEELYADANKTPGTSV